jgi:hypothetical protein
MQRSRTSPASLQGPPVPPEVVIECPRSIAVDLGEIGQAGPGWVDAGTAAYVYVHESSIVGVEARGRMLAEVVCTFDVGEGSSTARVKRRIHPTGAQFWCEPLHKPAGKRWANKVRCRSQ